MSHLILFSQEQIAFARGHSFLYTDQLYCLTECCPMDQAKISQLKEQTTVPSRKTLSLFRLKNAYITGLFAFSQNSDTLKVKTKLGVGDLGIAKEQTLPS